MIELKGICKKFNAGKPNELTALQDINCSIKPHKCTLISGSSAAGKSTLLSIIACMQKPTSGRLFVFEQEVSSLSERFLGDLRAKTFGVVFQRFHLIDDLSALQNVMLALLPNGKPYATLKQKASELLDDFGLKSKLHSPVKTLSVGQMQRVAIARALINDPPVIIADEPTAHLDSKLKADFITFIQRFKDLGKTVIIASHDPVIADCGVVDDIIRLSDGRIVDAS